MRVSNPKLWIVVTLVALTLVVTLLVVARREPVEASGASGASVNTAGGTSATSRADAWKQSDQALGHQREYRDAIEELSLILSSSGFAPAQITPSSGRFMISVDNRTDLKELVLKLTDKSGKHIRELRVPGGPGDWSELIELKGGKYVVFEASHPDWTCQIIVP